MQLRQRHFIDAHKGLTPLVIVAMMGVYDAWDVRNAWTYLALHGTYGLLWVLKSRAFPDRSWEERTGIPYGLAIWLGLSLYWIAPWLIVSQRIQAGSSYTAVCISVYVLGVFLHFAADMQKHTALQSQPGVLITDGLFARTRNPNYLGELCIYMGFGALAKHWLPGVVILLFVVAVWIPNIRKKERSLARYPEFAAYRARTGLLFPRWRVA